MRMDLESLIKGEAGKGDTIQFWCDSWLDHGVLKDIVPLQFAMEKEKRYYIC